MNDPESLIKRMRCTPPQLKQRIRDFHGLERAERMKAKCVNCNRERAWEGDLGQALCPDCAPAYKFTRVLHHRVGLAKDTGDKVEPIK